MLDCFYRFFPRAKRQCLFPNTYNGGPLGTEKELLKKITLNPDPGELADPQLIDNSILSFNFPRVSPANLLSLLHLLQPWRKGPFRINQIDLDGEWRSDIKWQHLVDEINISGKRILDIGANNGYYMFRLLLEKPAWVLGLDPTFHYWAQYFFFRQFIKSERLLYLRAGHQILPFFNKKFDMVLCLGIIYHTTDPIFLLKNIHSALDRGGELILESQGILGEDPLVLIPRGRYAGAKGMWFIPTPKALEHWLIRVGFNQVKIFHCHQLSPGEQRKTKWYQGKSLAAGLSPQDTNKTIEGYPAPHRLYLKAQK